MSFADPKTLSPSELVAQYVLTLRGNALFLPYQDYAVIEDWLAHAQCADELLLALSDILPGFFNQNRKPSLVGVQSLVLNRLASHKMRGV
ncbi:MAG: hypothetical protein FJ146_04645 [Deltaproteobacteria bacterium]|nr:hypothetical protein [Deltaproteobacteria bacterium]